ncbi:MAG: hypothetical protein ABS57_07395 [Mesorhizobium sp. SCN 65-12]|nr:MAG: hypothetical protein ABS57_07395 [Mesorhizobium sp. SCN 65-12]
MLFNIFLVLGMIALPSAVALAMYGLTSKEIKPAQRVRILLGSAIISIPGFLTAYLLFVFLVVLFQ